MKFFKHKCRRCHFSGRSASHRESRISCFDGPANWIFMANALMCFWKKDPIFRGQPRGFAFSKREIGGFRNSGAGSLRQRTTIESLWCASLLPKELGFIEKRGFLVARMVCVPYKSASCIPLCAFLSTIRNREFVEVG